MLEVYGEPGSIGTWEQVTELTASHYGQSEFWIGCGNILTENTPMLMHGCVTFHFCMHTGKVVEAFLMLP